MTSTGIALMLAAIIATVTTLALPLSYKATERCFMVIAALVIVGGLLYVMGVLIW